MTGFKEAFDDIAAEITPNDPPVELTMRQGRRMRNGRLAAVIGGTAGTIVIGAGAAFGIPALAGNQGSPAVAAATPRVAAPAGQVAAPADSAPLFRPVLLYSPHGNASGQAYGDASLVNAATLRLFRTLSCEPGPNAVTVNDHWKAALGYTAAQWDVPGNQVVSCDSSGGKYVLGAGAVPAAQVTSAIPALEPGSRQWVVNVTLDKAAAKALGTLTTNQYDNYYAGCSTDGNSADCVLDDTAVVLNGDVLEAPQIDGPLTSGKFMIQGPQPDGFTKSQAAVVAAQL